MSQTPSGSCSYTHLNANGTTTIKSGIGVLGQVVINTKGATSSTITIYDNTSAAGAVIAVIDATGQLLTFIYNVAFVNGLTVVVANGTPPDITVCWQ